MYARKCFDLSRPLNRFEMAKLYYLNWTLIIPTERSKVLNTKLFRRDLDLRWLITFVLYLRGHEHCHSLKTNMQILITCR